MNSKHEILLYALTIATLIAVAAGCTSPNECLQNMDVAYKVKFMKVAYDQGSESYVASQVSVVTSVHGLGRDSMLYDSVQVNGMALPLQSNDTISAFVICQQAASYGDTVMVSDTLWVIHDNELEFVSVECGCAVQNKVRDVIHTVNMIDSVARVADMVDRKSIENLKIYVRNR